MDDFNFKKAFDIGDIPKNIDLNSPPLTGFDYLYRVRLETRKCPKVVVSDIDTTKFLARQTVQVDACNGFIRARPGFEPDTAWQSEQIEVFRSTRSEMSQNRETLKKKFQKRELPKILKMEEWCLFCFGSEFRDRIYSEDQSPETSEVDQPKAKKPRQGDTGNPPLLSIMLYLNQTCVTKLLSYHVNWLEEVGFSDVQGKWLYSLLLCLEKPLDPDTCALLRNLSRLCSKQRDNLLSSDDEFLKPLNLILSIISQYFDQKDMSDCFSSL